MPEAGRSGIPKPRRTAYVHEASAADFLRRTSGVMTESGDSPLTVTQVEQVRPGITTSWGKEYYLVLTLSDATVVPARWYIEFTLPTVGMVVPPYLIRKWGLTPKEAR